MIKFNKAPNIKDIDKYVLEAIRNGKTSGDGPYTFKCQKLLENKFDAEKILLTNSGTAALEMAAILCGIKKDDEVIMPSFTYVSTANAFVIRGATVKFIDIDKKTMNMDTNLIENAITKKTKVIALVHYAGVSCDMDEIMRIAKKHNLKVVEDAAQAVMSKYKGKYLGTIGDYGCYSFHETKNYSMGEGGALVINNKDSIELAQIIRSNGTDRSKYLEGKINKYTWISKGSSYLPSEISAAYLYPQLLMIEQINIDRIETWNYYYNSLKELVDENKIELPSIPDYALHNAHIFYIKCKNIDERTKLISYLVKFDIISTFHYIPLHSSIAGIKYGDFIGKDNFTTSESERLLRLPIYYKMEKNDVDKVCKTIKNFYNKTN